jgi:hypothetical protein
MNYTEVELQQKEILKRVYDSEECQFTEDVTGVLKTIRAYNEEEAVYAMGDFGRRLRDFADIIDLKHPDLARIYSGQLVGEKEGTFSKDACDLLKLAAYGKAWGLSQNVLENLKRVISKSEHYSTLSRAIDTPFLNQLHVRFLLGRLSRDQVRGSKRMQPVGLGNLYRKGSPFWDQHPTSFESYYRNANRFQRDIDEGESRKAHFLNHRLTSMGAEIQRGIDDLKSKAAAEQYHGFNKISLATAAIILGKMCNYQFVRESNNLPDNAIAYARPNVYPNYDFFDNSFTNEGSFLFNKIEYTPRIYTMNELQEMTSDENRKLVDYLDSFPALGAKPIFDYYRVLVPGLNYPNSFQKPPFHFKNPDGTVVEFDTIELAQIALDRTLLKEKVVPAIILGELDGDHYFIGYWT